MTMIQRISYSFAGVVKELQLKSDLPILWKKRLLWENIREAKLGQVSREVPTELVTAAVSIKLKREEARKTMRVIQDSRLPLEELTSSARLCRYLDHCNPEGLHSSH
ncbi:uncharacterized protein LOC112346128 [Selaginella moellendorffii]|uniref:uncharacterized protein LOC112346128 n=1 Tax=Selaginella moellendorffii TaxID=88036 RepID=UPI000D1C7CDC|nr:uncharacterized protein LOC112346128 [Selaginella moellendorffii]|eukprot:XP_024530066.1 uncharacterized protein LOC112346128 [Selaginella moellendorffii]